MNRKVAHVLLMLQKNYKSYWALSITIVISFAIFLGYALVMDTQNYNCYKEVKTSPVNVVYAWENNTSNNIMLAEAIMKQQRVDYQKYQYKSVSAPQKQYNEKLMVSVYLLPNGCKEVYKSRVSNDGEGVEYPASATIINGKSFQQLESNEAVIAEYYYSSLKDQPELPFEMEVLLPIGKTEGQYYKKTVQVVGIARTEDDKTNARWQNNKNEDNVYIGEIYVNQSGMQDVDLAPERTVNHTVYISNQQKELIACLNKASVSSCSSIVANEQANRQSKDQAKTKEIVLLLLILILGVNLFGSMSNVIMKRQYEIGIKRAIGASASDIISQFFMESFCVMILNQFMAVFLVIFIATIYKVIIWINRQKQIIIYLSNYSVAQYLITSILLTISFSIYLAYKATKVEIVSQLKSE